MLARVLLSCAVVVLVGCLKPELSMCGDVACAADATCIEETRCASREAVDACVALADGEACVTPVFGGVCAHGACWADDLDGDFVRDAVDNCRDTANASQQDLDGDGFGDACDRCPVIATEIDHDEDGDLVGDACDLCPALEDFQKDLDGNGVGDGCEFGTRRVFDPFLELGLAWITDGAVWRALGDSVVPTAGALALRRPDLELSSPRLGLLLNVLSTRPWQNGDKVALRLRHQDGAAYAFCVFECGPDRCVARGYLEQFGLLAETEFQPSPTLRFALGITIADTKNLYCSVSQEAGTVISTGATLFTAPITGSPEIESQPGLEVTAFEAYD